MIALDYNDSNGILNKKISELSSSIESQQSLLTSLLFDTYTNSTFVASDLNVIRINTSNNYDKITNMESSKMNLSVSTKFQESSKMTEYVLTTLFTSLTSDLSMMFQFIDTAIMEKLDSTLSTVFASTSQFSVLSEYLLKSDYSTDISLKMDASNSTVFASESTISDLLKVSDFNAFTSTLPTTFSNAKYVNISEYSISSFPDYNGTVLYDATGTDTFLSKSITNISPLPSFSVISTKNKITSTSLKVK